MNPERLLQHFDRIAEAPDAIPRLRRFILDLAVRGKLVEQDPNDEPASKLLKRIQAEKARLAKEGKIRKAQPLPKIPADQYPFLLPDNWFWSRLGEVITLLSGQHLQPNEYSENDQSGPPYVTGPADFGPAGLVISRYALVRKAVAIKGQLLLTVKGAGVGKTAICDLSEVAISRQLMALTAIRWSQRFLVLTTHLLAETLKEKARSLIPGIARDDVELFVFGLPPLAEQHRIVAKVDELMALCDQLEAAKTEREQGRDRLVAASLHRLNSPADTAESDASDLPGRQADTFRDHARFVFHHLPRLTTRPEHIKQLRQAILNLAVHGRFSAADWLEQSETLKAVATLQNGYAFKSEWFVPSGIRLLRNTNVSHGTLCWDELACLPENRVMEFERFLLSEGDVVLSLDRSFIVTGTKVARVRRQDMPCLLLQRVGRFQLNSDRLCPDYLFLWLNSPHFTSQINPGRSNGVPHISSKQVEATKIFVPPLSEQHRIVARVDELMALCDQLEAQLTATEADSRRLLEAVLHEVLAPALEETV